MSSITLPTSRVGIDRATRERDRPRSGGSPIFILCTARSGSTLLRYILDAHPDIFCPGETNFAQILASSSTLCSVFRSIDPTMDGLMASIGYDIVERTFERAARAFGKGRWCDKSLGSSDVAEGLLSVFPAAQFVCLYRDPLDVIQSLAEVSSWGFVNFGVGPYMAARSTNVTLGLAEYWMDKASNIYQFENEHPDACFRLRYEDLVGNVEESVRALLSFLRVKWSDQCIDPATIFSPIRDNGPGDLKIRHASAITTNSVGRGWRVPTEMLPDELKSEMNELLAELKYEALDSEARRHTARLAGQPVVHRLGADVAERVDDVRELFINRVAPRIAGYCADYPLDVAGPVVQIRVIDMGESWVVDMERAQVWEGEAPEAWLGLAEAATVLRIANGELDPNVAMQRGELRLIRPTRATDDDESERIRVQIEKFAGVLLL